MSAPSVYEHCMQARECSSAVETTWAQLVLVFWYFCIGIAPKVFLHIFGKPEQNTKQLLLGKSNNFFNLIYLK